ncbi:S8 family peptidase [Lysobacter auxotrophicus]|uniref:S8 family serine peptidase n=1 Tax=Lysobacter auxotrophicus TaxID=2992573 RepID=A0ABN6UJY6_9GAMM|nr:S8 family peptidase [Lysobacter auxotrophicus]BDU16640.1 S8 family serine peptidase [Lysobacter auxotrophicus]
MIFRRTVLSLLIAGACAPVFAGTVDLTSLDDATLSPRFIVKYKSGSAERAQSDARQRSLDAAATRARPQMGARIAALQGNAALHVQSLRATVGGKHVVKATQRLNRTEAEALMRAIAADPNVESVAVDRLMHAAALPNDPVLTSHQMWHYGTGAGGARVTTAWDSGASGAGVVVAVIDTGATHHADLEPNLLPGYDFITDAFVSRRATDGRVPGGWDTGDYSAANECGAGAPAENSSWHGTHVSGTIAEVTNNGVGGAGIAYNAKVVPVRVLGRCGGYTSDINDAIVWAAGGHIDGVPDNPNPAEVINMSLGGAHECEVDTQTAINAAVGLGATIVVAAGNDNSPVTGHAPASCANVVTVGATGASGQRASYSNYGAGVDLAAPGGAGTEGVPGGYIWSTLNNGTTVPGSDIYAGYTGTSMATPHVAGVVALMQSVVTTPLTPAQVEGLLKATTRAFPVKQTQANGAGLLDAAAAVERARSFGQPINGLPTTPGIAMVLPPMATGERELYTIDVPAGATKIDITTYGGRGEVQLLLGYEADPLPNSNVGASARPGINQAITVANPAPGHYYLALSATKDTSGARLLVKVN